MTRPGDDDFSEITDDFFRRLDAGENPTVEEFAARYAAQASKLRALLPILIGMRCGTPADASGDSPPKSAGIEAAPPAPSSPQEPRKAFARGAELAEPHEASAAAPPPHAIRRPSVRIAGAALAALVVVVAYYAVSGSSNQGPAPSSPPPRRTYEDLDGMQFVEIPGGEFEMGAAESDIRPLVLARGNENRKAELESELPARKVRITRPFYLAKYEVTVDEFRKFVATTCHLTDVERSGQGVGWNRDRGRGETDPRYTWENPGFEQAGDHPVVLVSWNDAQAFCAWKSARENAVYRLPTEAEWELARRDGTPPVFELPRKFANVADTSLQRLYTTRKVEPVFDGRPFTAPVGSFSPGAYGAYDLTGNVYEWCFDRHSPNYRNAAALDPTGPNNGALRAARGGSWNRMGIDLRVTSRAGAADPSTGNYETGFRVVRESP